MIYYITLFQVFKYSFLKTHEKGSFPIPCSKMPIGIFLFSLKSDFQKVRKTAKNEENPRKSRVFLLASFLSRYIVGGFRNFAFGEYSHTLRLASELADLRVATADRILCAKAHRARFDEGVAPPKTKRTPEGVLALE